MPEDRFGRSIHYLRVSLTDRCNLRCVYCMPEQMHFRPRAEFIQDDELIALTQMFARLGFRKFRLTGGEPTARQNVVEIVRAIAATPGVHSLSMTTKGMLLEKVWAGVRAAERAGLEPVKLNAVVVRGYNEEDVPGLARLTLENDWQARFIERMPLGSISQFQQEQVVPTHEVIARIEARLYRIRGASGTLGFIASVTQPFCAQCTRARLTADGRLRLCLLCEKELDVLSLMRSGLAMPEIEARVGEAIWHKPWGHGLAHNVVARNRVMSEIGG